MQNTNPFTFWQQCCTAPWQAQSAYWQTVSTIMQARVKAATTWQQQAQECLESLSRCTTFEDWQKTFTAWYARSTAQCLNLGADTHAARAHLFQTWQQLGQGCGTSTTAWQQAFQNFQTACTTTSITQPTTQSGTSQTQNSTPQNTTTKSATPSASALHSAISAVATKAKPQPVQTVTPESIRATSASATALQSALNTIAAKAKPQPTLFTPTQSVAATKSGPSVVVGKLAQPFPPSTGKFTPALPGKFIPSPSSQKASQQTQTKVTPTTQVAAQPQQQSSSTDETSQTTNVTSLRARQTGGHSGAVAARASAASSARHSVVARRSASRRAR